MRSRGRRLSPRDRFRSHRRHGPGTVLSSCDKLWASGAKLTESPRPQMGCHRFGVTMLLSVLYQFETLGSRNNARLRNPHRSPRQQCKSELLLGMSIVHHLNLETRPACSRITLALSFASVPTGSPMYFTRGFDQYGMRGQPPQLSW
jgi:hypothetical protein